MESLNRRSFADRVQSAFDKVAGPMQEGEELNKRATLNGKANPALFPEGNLRRSELIDQPAEQGEFCDLKGDFRPRDVIKKICLFTLIL